MKILLPLDGSELSESAIPYAVELARRNQGQLLLLRAVDPFVSSAPGLQPSLSLRLQEHAMSEVARYLKDVEGRCTGLPVESRSSLGSPRDEIAHTAARENCQLIVMASHGRSGPARWLLGSVAEGVLRQTPCPVLLVRPSSSPRSTFGHVLVPIDGSQASREVAHKLGPYLSPDARLTLLRSTGTVLYASAVAIDAKVVQEYLVSLATDLGAIDVEGVSPEIEVVDGDAALAILDYSQEQECDLIAMSTHGRSGFRRFMLGSVTEKVARSAPCPVLVFPGSEANPS